MALEKLAGPYTIVDSARGDNPIEVAYNNYAIWDDEVGLCTYSDGGGGMMVVQMDGIAYPRSYMGRSHKMVVDYQRENGFLAQEAIFASKIYDYDKHAAQLVNNVVLAPPGGMIMYHEVRLLDRYIFANINGVYSLALDGSSGTTGTLEHSWGTTLRNELIAGSATYPSYSHTNKKEQICITFESGHVIFYDHVATQVASVHRLPEQNRGCYYSKKFNVLISINRGAGSPPYYSQMNVWSLAPRPANITNPTPDASFVKGKATRVRVQVTGSYGEKCAGETVEWSLTGAGSLTDLQSIANSEGYAETYYVAPVDSLPSVTIGAQVRF